MSGRMLWLKCAKATQRFCAPLHGVGEKEEWQKVGQRSEADNKVELLNDTLLAWAWTQVALECWFAMLHGKALSPALCVCVCVSVAKYAQVLLFIN